MAEPEQNHLGQPIGLSLPNWKPPPPPSRHVMEGRHCALAPLTAAAHAPSLHAAHALDLEGRNWTYLPYGPFATQQDYAAWISTCETSHDPLFFAVCDARGQAVGVAAYLRIDPANGCIEIGHLNFSPLLQRTPAATEALYLLMREVFALGYRRCEWKCDALNAPSRDAALRLGFRFEGVFRQASLYKGRSRDTAWFSIIDSDWPALERAFVTWLDPANFDSQGQQRLRLSTLTSPP